MKRLFSVLCVCCLLASMSACGKSESTSSIETDPVPTQIETAMETEEDTTETETETEPQTEHTTEEVATTEEISAEEENVNISIHTSQMMETLDVILVDLLRNKGIDANYTVDLIEFAAPQSVMDEVAADYRNTVNDLGKEPSETVVSMEIKEDYTDITFWVTPEFDNSLDGLALLLMVQPVYEMQILTGKTDENFSFTETLIDSNSGEIIKIINIPDDLTE